MNRKKEIILYIIVVLLVLVVNLFLAKCGVNKSFIKNIFIGWNIFMFPLIFFLGDFVFFRFGLSLKIKEIISLVFSLIFRVIKFVFSKINFSQKMNFLISLKGWIFKKRKISFRKIFDLIEAFLFLGVGIFESYLLLFAPEIFSSNLKQKLFLFFFAMFLFVELEIFKLAISRKVKKIINFLFPEAWKAFKKIFKISCGIYFWVFYLIFLTFIFEVYGLYYHADIFKKDEYIFFSGFFVSVVLAIDVKFLGLKFCKGIKKLIVIIFSQFFRAVWQVFKFPFVVLGKLFSEVSKVGNFCGEKIEENENARPILVFVLLISLLANLGFVLSKFAPPSVQQEQEEIKEIETESTEDSFSLPPIVEKFGRIISKPFTLIFKSKSNKTQRKLYSNNKVFTDDLMWGDDLPDYDFIEKIKQKVKSQFSRGDVPKITLDGLNWPVNEKCNVIYPWNTFGPDNNSRKHGGIDLFCAISDNVFAIAPGIVIKVIDNFANHKTKPGAYIVIYHATEKGDFLSYYIHNSAHFVKVDDRVAGGQRIASIGDSGNANGHPHLHFELHAIQNKKDYEVNPLSYLPKIWEVSERVVK